MVVTGSGMAAIPTNYRGIQLKSRMEAQCAVLFDKLGWNWKYEPFSLMLPCGTTYIPDFQIEGPAYMIVECRGYESERGKRQINAFAAAVEAPPDGFILPDGESCSEFMVIGPGDAVIYRTDIKWQPSDRHIPATERKDYQLKPALFYHCGCGWQAFTAWCPNCEQHSSAALIITVKDGRIFANGMPVEDFGVDHA